MKPMCHPGTRQKNSCHLYCSLQLKIYMLSLLISTINPCIYFVNHCARVQDIPQIKAFTVYFCRHSVLVFAAAAAAAKLLQPCLTLSDPMDCSLPGSSAHGTFQARVLECIAIAFSVEIVTDLIFLGFKITFDVTAAMKLKDVC